AEVMCVGDSWLTDSRTGLATELAAFHTGLNIISMAAPEMKTADIADPGQCHLHRFRQAPKDASDCGRLPQDRGSTRRIDGP
ncbi:MAG: hypothetical protein ACKO15_03030, partial [Burkholderiales bacterium]